MACVDAEVLTELVAGPGEGAAAAPAYEVGTGDVPDLADDGDDLAG